MSDSAAGLTHHTVLLDDGHRVGVSVGGHGVPLVFQHGVAMNRLTYQEVLSRFTELGFLVIALDAGGHGETAELPEPRDFGAMSRLTVRTLDALGVHRAVFLGHSMGGRMTVELAARWPERVLCAVLIDAASGTTFDRIAHRASTAPHTIALGLANALYDTALEQLTLRGAAHLHYARIVSRTVLSTLRRPTEPLWAVRAIAAAYDSSQYLRDIARQGVSAIVLHARRDRIVPFQSAVDTAALAHAALYEIPDASHGWLLANPDRAASVMSRLLENELGAALREAFDASGANSWAAWTESLLAPAAPLRPMLGTRCAPSCGQETVAR